MKSATRRGQTMVLACVTMLMMALMVMLSFNLANAIHEKIRIQNHADAEAYSIAVMEARAYNSLSYSNRAIAAAFVAQMSLHAWYAIASEAYSIHNGFFLAFLEIAAEEAASICDIMCGPFCCDVVHIPHVIKAIKVAMNHNNAKSQIGNKIKGLESDFNNAVDGYAKAVNLIHQSQNAMLATTLTDIASSGSSTLSTLKANNAKGANYAAAIDALNIGNFTCPLEGSNISGAGGACDGNSASTQERSKIMETVADGTRVAFVQNGTVATNAGSDFFSMSNYLQEKQDNDGTTVVFFTEKAGVGSSTSNDADPQANQQLSTVGSTSSGAVLATWGDCFHAVCVGGAPISSEVHSDKSSGKHENSGAHSGSHNKFPGCVDSDCFVNFKSGSKDKDYNQPTAYGGVSQDLRWTPNNQKPWEVTTSGTVNVNMGEVGAFNMSLVPSTAYAVGKAKTYFHQMGNWQVAPNMFDPFWRAKLHAFNDSQELTKAAAAAGDTNVFVGPVEGK